MNISYIITSISLSFTVNTPRQKKTPMKGSKKYQGD